MANNIFLSGTGGRIFMTVLRSLAMMGQIEKVKGVSASSMDKDIEGIAERIHHDSTHGYFPLAVWAEIDTKDDRIGYFHFRDKDTGRDTPPMYSIPIFGNPDPEKLPLKELDIDVTIEATGKFLTREKASKYLNAGSKKVLMSAPAKDDTPLIIYQINGDKDTGLDVVSLASCTTNCAAPIVKALSDKYGDIKSLFLNTTHAVTNSQNLLDGNNSKIANSYAGLDNIIVTDTGATKSLTKIFDNIGSTTGISCRVPVSDGSVCCMVLTFDDLKGTTKEEVNEVLHEASNGYLFDLLNVSRRKVLTSTAVIGVKETSYVAPNHTEVIGNQIRIVSGYDNEYGYAYQLAKAALECPLPN